MSSYWLYGDAAGTPYRRGEQRRVLWQTSARCPSRKPAGSPAKLAGFCAQQRRSWQIVDVVFRTLNGHVTWTGPQPGRDKHRNRLASETPAFLGRSNSFLRRPHKDTGLPCPHVSYHSDQLSDQSAAPLCCPRETERERGREGWSAAA